MKKRTERMFVCFKKKRLVHDNVKGDNILWHLNTVN